jgi:hypothetical protein
MENGKFVSYLRVSAARQSASGLGLGAQRAAVAADLNGDWTLLKRDRRGCGSALTAFPSVLAISGSFLWIGSSRQR